MAIVTLTKPDKICHTLERQAGAISENPTKLCLTKAALIGAMKREIMDYFRDPHGDGPFVAEFEASHIAVQTYQRLSENLDT